ncbi:hypothetical protein LMG26857_03369 [Achromobacter anxifer]|uniref:hypothetical protein n=1 Tax=Achromobacter anxifer TaxID=1287737 RepID=UPI00155C8B2C|nr:hypothetical protein [Achromobacter anxifer]CAB5514310.1 hypothetical protein LMG26857_03369 [Achromobacter anxifer]
MITKITIDDVERQFVVSTGNSTSCLSFDVVFHQATELLRRLRSTLAPSGYVSPSEQVLVSEIGTEAQYMQHQRLLELYSLITDKQTWFDGRTPDAVQEVLERYRRSGAGVRIYIGDPATGRDGLYEYDTIGTIGRVGGWMCLPTLVPVGQSEGGAIVTHAVIRIQDIGSSTDVYRHPLYHVPEMKLVEVVAPDLKELGYTHEVLVEGPDGHQMSQTRTKSLAHAAHWIAFMHGRVHNLHEAEI